MIYCLHIFTTYMFTTCMLYFLRFLRWHLALRARVWLNAQRKTPIVDLEMLRKVRYVVVKLNLLQLSVNYDG